jgi:hypothetical protein
MLTATQSVTPPTFLVLLSFALFGGWSWCRAKYRPFYLIGQQLGVDTDGLQVTWRFAVGYSQSRLERSLLQKDGRQTWDLVRPRLLSPLEAEKTNPLLRIFSFRPLRGHHCRLSVAVCRYFSLLSERRRCFDYLHLDVPKREQCNIQETEETAELNTLTAVAKERPSYYSVGIGQSIYFIVSLLSKQVPLATNTHATTEELLYKSFPMRCLSYQRRMHG